MSRVKFTDYMFSSCSSLASLDVSGWDMSGVEEMYAMFSGCSSLKRLDVSGWDVRRARTISGLFADCASLTSLDLSGWDMSGERDLGNLLRGCSGLREVRLGPRCPFLPYLLQEETAWVKLPDSSMGISYNNNWVREDGADRIKAAELAEGREVSPVGTWVRTTDTSLDRKSVV